MKTRIYVFLACLLVPLALHSQDDRSRSADALYEISGGSRGGGFNTLIERIDRALRDIEIDALFSAGGAENLRLLRDGTVEFALSQSDVAYHTYNGEHGIEENRQFRAVLPLSNAYQQLFVRDSSGPSCSPPEGQSKAATCIDNFSDLLGGRVIAMGAMGSGSFTNGRDVLDAAGIDYMLAIEDLDSPVEGREVATDEMTITINGDTYALIPVQTEGTTEYFADIRCPLNFESMSVSEQELRANYRQCSSGVGEIDLDRAVRIRELGSGPGLAALQGCGSPPAECVIDAVMLTGSARTREGLKHIAIPVQILTALADRFPYYSVSPSPAFLRQAVNDTFESDMLSVTTYLLANPGVSDSRVRRITEAILENWTPLSVLVPDLVDRDEALKKQPFPFHDGALEVLQDRGLVLSLDLYRVILLATAAFCLILYFWGKYRRTYDRLGRTYHQLRRNTPVRSQHYIARTLLPIDSIRSDALAQSVGIVLVIFIAFWAMAVGIALIKLSEGEASATADLTNDFASRGFWASLIWIFTWMATGYENNVYPNSGLGRWAVAAIGLVGVAAPLGAFFSFFTIRTNRRASRDRGESDQIISSLRGHTLICGWNSKVPGLVYSLTGEDAPRKLNVVVVAEMDEEFPLRKYHFDAHYVHYCRGDSADLRTLESANARHAANAIIVAGRKRLTREYAASPLTALALKSMNPDVFIMSETSTKSQELEFQDSGIDVSVDGLFVANRLIALSSQNPNVVDFVLDILTYDEFTECSSRTISELFDTRDLRAQGMTAGTLFLKMQQAGLNVLAISSPNDVSGTGSDTHSSHRHNFLVTPDDHLESLNGNETVLFNYEDVKLLSPQKRPISLVGPPRRDVHAAVPESVIKRIETRLFSVETSGQDILIIGNSDRAEQIAAELGTALGEEDIVDPARLDESETDEGAIAELIKCRLSERRYDTIVLLNNASSLRSIEYDECYVGDSEVILRCQLSNRWATKNDARLTVIGEVNLPENLELLERTGAATVVIPTGILTERFLSKPVYDRGNVTGPLIDLMDGRQGPHLRSMVIHKKHPLYGIKFSDALRTVYADGRVIGCVPARHAPRLRNRAGDFRTHFETTPTHVDKDAKLDAGDVIISIIDQSATSGL